MQTQKKSFLIVEYKSLAKTRKTSSWKWKSTANNKLLIMVKATTKPYKYDTMKQLLAYGLNNMCISALQDKPCIKPLQF